ncbi:MULTISPECIES: hemophore [unclassified Mycobacterium]|uniref:hemophore n=1 Tax=unclassified Mycobacterium TaxID=2642494 RepID=UPI0007400EA0|nr:MULTISPECIES: hemophore [unclassified Mycobacterium]KUH82312.1 Fis family transcriptional regulator [Mycobacterium sp. GA-0227b]KUH90170.1 Fis family transcriptional regulator [Mycobacterium sp. GA-1999]KUH95050.1 Fis family transcriptional regulator [Mycobacterium sp. IS-1556]
MKTTTGLIRRGLFGVLAACAAGGAVVAALVTPAAPLMPSATAAQDPCAASELARTIGEVATSTGEYLEEHPQTNQALTTISKQQAGPQSLAAVKTYFDANPKVAKDMQQLQQPLASLSGKCKLPFTLPQVVGLLQAAQQGGGLPASLPAQAPAAQSAGLPAAGATAHMPAAAPVSQGTAATPGSAIAGLP